jgi:histidyl-tRNA synthetase
MRIERDFKLLVLLTIILAVFLGLGCPTVALPLEAPQRYEDSMAPTYKPNRPKARVAKGFRDISADEIRGTRAMLATIQRVYESYGFEPIEQPFIEYTDALGKFLPDQDRPNAGVFSFQDEDEQWLSLRYDLTAPLARYVAENNQKLPTPFRSYRQGWVFRNEKPGPGRFRQFMQFDADTVGSSSPAADAEVCMMAADTMEALGIPKGQYKLKISNRKLIDGLMMLMGLAGPEMAATRLSVLRTFDKMDKFSEADIKLLLGAGRKDESGDFTIGAGLSEEVIAKIEPLFYYKPDTIAVAGNTPDVSHYIAADGTSEASETSNEIGRASDFALGYWLTVLHKFGADFNANVATLEGHQELMEMLRLIHKAGYSDRIIFDPSVIRGLEYYTGPIFECELLMETLDEKGRKVRFGSVGGGGRYDDLVARFTGQQTPATGFSIGVSRLYAALKLVGKAEESDVLAPVVVTVMDKDRQGDYWGMVQSLRAAGIRAEMSLGAANMGKQMKYADKRGSPLVVIQGGDEKALGQVTIKDLRLGAELASSIETREEYASQRLAQVTVAEADLVSTVRKMLGQ